MGFQSLNSPARYTSLPLSAWIVKVTDVLGVVLRLAHTHFFVDLQFIIFTFFDRTSATLSHFRFVKVNANRKVRFVKCTSVEIWRRMVYTMRVAFEE